MKDVMPSKIEVDQSKLQQILINLFSNSIKFTDKGKINIISSFQRYKDSSLLIPTEEFNELQNNKKILS